MHIGVLTHNYPRFAGDFSGVFVEALCEEFTRQRHTVSVWAPYDPAFRWPPAKPPASDKRTAAAIARPGSAVRLHLYRYAWPDRLNRLGYMRSMQSDLALRLETYALSPLFFARGIAAVLAGARRTRPDVLHAHWLLPNGFIAALASRRLGIPLVVSVPGSDAQVAGKNPLFRAMARFAFNQADQLTANSSELRDAVVSLGADPAKFDLILYGVDPAELRPDETGVAELRAHLLGGDRTVPNPQSPISNPPLILLCVGRMVHKKGFDVLLHALTLPPLAGRNVTVVMIGNGDEKAAWQQLATDLGVDGQVRWVGTVPKNQIGVYYNAADLLVMPSVSKPADGLNVCVLDAMSCGKPVVASNVAGNPLVVIDGESGLIVPEQDPAALASALARLADDHLMRTRMGAAARRRIDEELGWPHLALRYVAHFQRLAGLPDKGDTK
jgi:glycosyltransferase involved in cell wall biosynthesis